VRSAERVVAALIERGETLAVAESLTGGLLAATIVEVAGASAAFRGGLIVYATDLKASLAGVDATLLAERGPVDGEVATALAAGARSRCGSDWGIATTGVAGPAEQNGIHVGTVFVGAYTPEGARPPLRLQLAENLGRAGIRRRTVDESLSWLLELFQP
jgi:nicotinamide-nucleotide amidase